MEDQPPEGRSAYWEERLAAHPGIEGVGYLGLGSAYNDWLYRLRARIFKRTVRRLGLRDDARVFDVGSGTGFYLEQWKRAGVGEIVGSDLTQVAVGRLQAGRDDRIIQLDITGPLPDGLANVKGFDAVSAFDVLFHIVDDDRYEPAIKNIASLLVDGGAFVFSENFLHRDSQRSPHQVNRSLDEINAILDRAGFDVLQRRPMMVLMNAPIDSNRAWLGKAWTLLTGPARLHDVLGHLVGAVLFAVDLVLTSVLKESPSTEICICRKRVRG
jgi:SAM-dependent methyltransferase